MGFFVAGSPVNDFSFSLSLGRGPGVTLHAGSPAFLQFVNTVILHGRPGCEGIPQPPLGATEPCEGCERSSEGAFIFCHIPYKYHCRGNLHPAILINGHP